MGPGASLDRFGKSASSSSSPPHPTYTLVSNCTVCSKLLDQIRYPGLEYTSYTGYKHLRIVLSVQSHYQVKVIILFNHQYILMCCAVIRFASELHVWGQVMVELLIRVSQYPRHVAVAQIFIYLC